MKLLEEIIEKNSVYKILKKKKGENGLMHAYFFVSPDSIYRKEFQIKVAKLILESDEQVDALSHPDFKAIFESKTITVPMIADIVSDVYFMPIEADKKVYIIDDFSKMTEEAQNKLLKTIEEPPSSAILLLGASETAGVLQTILSRVQLFSLDKLLPEEISRVLENDYSIAGEMLENAVACSNGNLFKAKKLLEDKDFKFVYDYALKLFSLTGSRDILGYESQIDMKNFPISEYFDLTISICRDIMMVKSGACELASKGIIKELEQISKTISLMALVKTIGFIETALRDLSFNANPQAVFDDFLLKFVEVKVTCKG